MATHLKPTPSLLKRRIVPIVLLVAFLVTFIFALIYQFTGLPSINTYTSSRASIFQYSDGTEMGRVYREDRKEVPIYQVPLIFQEALLAAEDSNFYSHLGIDPISIARALLSNATTDSVRGGSTITQQYVKIAYLTPEQNITRKIKELFISLKIEGKYSKNEILEKYINAIYFGRNAYGVEIAARKYFGISAKALTPAQSIFLAALVRSPANYDPEFRPENFPRIVNRFNGIKANMVSEKFLSEEEARLITFPTLSKKSSDGINSANKGHLIAAVKTSLLELGYTEEQLSIGGYIVKTTLDRFAQRAAEVAVNSQRPVDSPKDLHIGLATVRPGTGEIVALYGGENYLERQLNDATQSIAQAGSTFKVFALIAGLEKGYSLSSVWDGRSPQVFYTQGENYRVSNYGNSNYGPVSLYKATASSINTVYVRLGTKVGSQSVVDVARRAGIPNEVQMLATPSVVLGVSSPRVLDVASAFATFAAQGIYAKPYIVESVTSRDGEMLFKAKRETKRVFDQKVMADLSYALSGVIRNGTASAVLAGFPRPIAGKTGTSQDNASAWFTGYSPDLSTSIAFFRDTPAQRLTGIGGLNSITGGTFPAKIWNAYMRRALQQYPISYFPAPAFVGGTRAVFIDKPKATATPTPTNKVPQPAKTNFTPRPIPTFAPKPIP